MSVQSITERGRRRTVDTVLTDVVWVHHKDPDAPAPVMDEETGQYPDVDQVTVYRGPARWQVKADINAGIVETNAGEHESAYVIYQLQTPTGPVPGCEGNPAEIRNDDVADCEASLMQPELVGRSMNVHGLNLRSHGTRLNFRLREPVS